MAGHYTRIMFHKTYFIILVLLSIKCRHVFGDLLVQKSSLTFVIDDTISMADDIMEVKITAKSILDTIINSKASQIENFVLTIFNDPVVQPSLVTTNKEEYIRALESIVAHGGGDCPELSLTGIEEALSKSLPRSYLFVFTDASAKDYEKFEQVKSLAQKKSIQIIFVLTGLCTTDMDPAYQVYQRLATATSGQVFKVEKNEVHKVLDYVKLIVEARRTVIDQTSLPPGYGNTLHFDVDQIIENVVLSISGNTPRIEILDPTGKKVTPIVVITTANIMIVKIDMPQAGTYTVIVGSVGVTVVIITGASRFDFVHGFSPVKPTTIDDTATRPFAGISSYLAIETVSPDIAVELTEVQLLDLNKNVLKTAPLYKVRDNFYVTEPLVAPDTMFIIQVKGFIKGTKIPIQRISATPIEPEQVPVKAPIITSVGENSIKINYSTPLELRCTVSGFPKPSIMWVDEKTGHKFTEMVQEANLPYDYVSVLKIDQVKETASYQCRTFNEYGEDRKSVQVDVINKFVVVEVSKDTSIYYGKRGSLKCVIDALPPAQITWYFDKTLLNEHDTGIEMSSDKSVLTITNMEPRFEGTYTCEAKNELTTHSFLIPVTMADKAPPRLLESYKKIEVKVNQVLDISCKVVGGIPPPQIRWYFQKQDTSNFIQISETSEVIHIPVADVDRAGIYRCEAYNAYGTANMDVTVVVLYPPIIKDDEKTVSTEHGKMISLNCAVSGVPSPTVKWTYNGGDIKFTHTIFKNNTIRFIASVANAGVYSCEAANDLGTASKTIEVIVYAAPIITTPEESNLTKIVGCSLTLRCEVIGFPKPTIQWVFYNKDSTKQELRPTDDSGSLHIPRLEVSNSGIYECLAQNSLGSSKIAYTVEVLSPPSIVHATDDNVTAVTDDLVLQLPCPASGNPKPSVLWTKDGFYVPSGQDCHLDTMYEVKGDGTLIIKDIDMTSNGTYMCVASNPIGIAFDRINVNVLKFPKPGIPQRIVKVEIGTSAKIECDIPHIRTDILRWYKDSKLIATGELILNNAQLIDQGIYTCRVSTLSSSTSASVSVEVGSKPTFIYDEGGNLEYYLGEHAYLSCSARGEPVPKVLWKYNDKTLDVTTMVLSFTMTEADIGRYECVVTNSFGTITRDYTIVKSD